MSILTSRINCVNLREARGERAGSHRKVLSIPKDKFRIGDDGDYSRKVTTNRISKNAAQTTTLIANKIAAFNAT
ncbi:hypothetical protein Bhyg_00871 [Pseudolycoriella hygida]|uniref:Uncharacterized protein n=1 Tax=Pseudolycoriella hygida TaxID=35572 RepID=A0A9Q0NAD7_9DIPT|nr:hypothetical protein Bhyg_00871 [Pseudolycoriella hygida]